jgi:hypothetical protein
VSVTAAWPLGATASAQLPAVLVAGTVRAAQFFAAGNAVTAVVSAKVAALVGGAVLYPFFDTLKAWGWGKRFLSISGLYLVLGYWASAVAAPGTIDGLIYLRPEITPYAHLMVQPEIVVQALILGAWVARWMVLRPGAKPTKANSPEA